MLLSKRELKSMWQEIESKRAKGICTAKYCGKPPVGRDRLCAKHRKRLQKINNPLSYTFNALKNNAKRRNKKFTLSLEEFKEFCEETNYLELKGQSPKDMTIDRINHRLGYSKDNIQIMSLSENSTKGNYERWSPEGPDPF